MDFLILEEKMRRKTIVYRVHESSVVAMRIAMNNISSEFGSICNQISLCLLCHWKIRVWNLCKLI